MPRLLVFTAQGFGLGLSPWAPGTFGSAGGVALAYALGQLLPAVALAAAAVICLASVPICTAAARELGGAKDPGSIVLDEMAAMPLVLWSLPVDSCTVLAAGFALFRVFDISKLPPARQLERLPEGLGIMADDWAAAIYAHLALRGLLWWGVI